MAVGQEDLLKRANELEMKEFQKNGTNHGQMSALGELLDDVYVTGRPKEIDYQNRRDLVRIFNEITKEIFGRYNTPVVEEYGSFVMDIFSAKSDLDLSVNVVDKSVGSRKDKKIQMLKRFANKFFDMQRNGHVTGVQRILSAKVPIVKLIDRGTGIECDISIENRDGIAKSQIVRMISSIDSRFQMLSFVMKAWAKAHHINSSVEHTLNSLSVISLVAFHLQTRDPPILPPFSAILKGGTDPISVRKEVDKFLNYGKGNTESLSELFVSLLKKLASAETLWDQGLCASTYEGSWVLKNFGPKLGCIKVEDFTDRSQNISRATRSQDLDKIYKCINLSIELVSSFMEGKIESTKLKELLFPPTPEPAVVAADKSNINSEKPQEKSVSVVAAPSIEGGTAESSISVANRKSKKKIRPAVPPEDPKPKKKKRPAVPPTEPKSKKKMRAAVPPVDPKPKQTVAPSIPPVVSRSEGRDGIPPVSIRRTTPVGIEAPRVRRDDRPTDNWGRMPVGSGNPVGNWGRTPPTVGFGITPADVLAALIGLNGIPPGGWGGQPGNIWERTAGERLVEARRVPSSENWVRPPTEGLYGTHGAGQYGGPATVGRGVAPAENWGRPPAQGLGGTHRVGQYGRPTTVGQGPTQGFGGTHGVGQYGGPTTVGMGPTQGLGGVGQYGGPTTVVMGPTQGLVGTHGLGQYGGPATVGRGVAPAENWGRPPMQGMGGTHGIGQYRGPSLGRGGPPPREGLGGAPGVGWQNMQESSVPYDWRRGDVFPRR